MDDLALLADLHRGGLRQGPGGEAQTRMAIALSGLADSRDLKIADIGCGTGASTLVLADALDAAITAVDFLPEFLTDLEQRSHERGLTEKISTVAGSMDDLSFGDASLDAIWSEGAVYNIGFENGIRTWRRFLKPGGVLAVSELTWLTAERPAELDRHWSREYPEVATAAAKMALLESHGYTPIGYFPLPESCWLDNYYRPLQQRFETFLASHDQSEAAQAIVAAEKAEIELYERFSAYFGYGFFLAKRLPE